MKFIELAWTTAPRELYRLIRRRIARKAALTGFDDRRPCTFVLSTGRVGSMTLAESLTGHPNIVAMHEPDPRLFRMSKVAYQTALAGPEEVWQAIFWSLRHDLIWTAMSEGRGFIETSPQGTFLAPVIAGAIPSAKFIHLVRHPAEVIRSGMRRNWYGGIASDDTRITPRDGTEAKARWSTMTQFQKIAWLWAETNNWITDFSRTIPADRTRLFHAEDLFSEGSVELDQLWEFVGAAEVGHSSARGASIQRLNVQQTGNFPKSHEWSDEMLGAMREIVGAAAETLGYRL